MKTLLNLVLFFWELPQNLLGIFLSFFYSTDNSLQYKGKTIRVCRNFPGGISLGNYVWVKSYPNNTRTWNIVRHEWGHTRQSRYLGPLYLLVIGLPSLIWAAISDYFDCSYYDFYTESWADELGGVER